MINFTNKEGQLKAQSTETSYIHNIAQPSQKSSLKKAQKSKIKGSMRQQVTKKVIFR